MVFLNGLTVLCLFQLMGEISVRLLKLPVPGAVVGMLFLFFMLLTRRRVSHSVETASTELLSHLSLLFVPAGVGIIAHFNQLASEWVPISIALVLSTLITLAATALIMQASDRFLSGNLSVRGR
ncbi:MAG: CidA/LrgA family protein [Cyanobacteria bacterium J06627_28]